MKIAIQQYTQKFVFDTRAERKDIPKDSYIVNIGEIDDTSAEEALEAFSIGMQSIGYHKNSIIEAMEQYIQDEREI